MNFVARLRSWSKWILKRTQMENDMDAEVRFHIESYAADLVRSGIPQKEALRRARIEFGGVESHKDAMRAALGLRWRDEFWIDLRYAARRMRRSPGFTFTAIMVLAVGIGVNVAAFSAFNLIVLKMLPVRDPDTLVRLERRSPENATTVISYPTVAFYREHAKTLSAVMATMGSRVEWENDVQAVNAGFVTANYFTELGSQAAYGRLLDPAQDDQPNAAPVVVLSFGFWQRRFDADPSIVGRTIHVNKKSATVVGIAPYEFASLGYQYPDVWLPLAQQPYFVEGSKVLTDASAGSVEMWARLAPGVTVKAAEAELFGLTNELRKQDPKDVWDREFIRIEAGGHMQVIKPEMYQAMALVGAFSLLILVVACANLGGLILARGMNREREIGIRVAVGARKYRIFRQLFTESLLLAFLGAMAGLALSCTVLRIVMAQSQIQGWISAIPDWRVCLFSAGIAFVAAICFGLIPALQLSAQRQRKTIARQILVGAQMAASCILLIVAGLLVRAAHHALYSNPGFGYEQVLSIDPQLGSHGYTPAAARAYLTELENRLRAAPGVTSVSLVKLPPLGRTIARTSVEIDGHPVDIYPNWIGPAFFQTMDIPLLMGRNLLPNETNAVILSESLARKQWPGENPLGKKFWDKDTVVGIVGNARMNALNDGETVEAYQTAQLADMPEMVVVVKTAGAPDGLMPMMKSLVESLDPKLFPEIRLLKSAFEDHMEGFELAAMIVSLLGMLAVLLSALGLVGLVAYAVSERTKEIAIRIALGAKSAHVLSAILRQFLWPVIIGLFVGLAGSVALSQFLRIMLFGISNLDPLSYASGLAVLIVIATIAALLPARRALHVDPMRALHCD